MRGVLLLEATKHKKTLLALAFISLLWVVLGPPFLWMIGRGSISAMSDIISDDLVIYGLPLIALILGTLYGTRLRTTSDMAAEESLPQHPLRRVFGAYGINVLALAIFASMSFAVLVIPDVVEHLRRPTMTTPALLRYEISMLLWLIPVMFHLNLVSFLLSYWLKQGILGAGMSVIIFMIQSFSLWTPANPLLYQMIPAERLYLPMSSVSPLICLGIDAAARLMVLAWLANHLERSLRIRWFDAVFEFLATFR